jgi:hypothetical protein
MIGQSSNRIANSFLHKGMQGSSPNVRSTSNKVNGGMQSGRPISSSTQAKKNNSQVEASLLQFGHHESGKQIPVQSMAMYNSMQQMQPPTSH